MKNLLAKRGYSDTRCQHGKFFKEPCILCEELPKIPEAKPNVQGMLVSNPAWRKYMRKFDTWEDTNEGHNQLEEHQVPTERVRPGDGGGGAVSRENRRGHIRSLVDLSPDDLRSSERDGTEV